MSGEVRIFDAGIRLFAERIAGTTDATINGMYLEYGDDMNVDVSGRSLAYFSELTEKPHSGYGRIAVQDIHVDPEGNIKVMGLFSCGDLKGGSIGKDTRLVAVTLACIDGASQANDIFLACTRLATPMKLVKGSAMSITITLNLE